MMRRKKTREAIVETLVFVHPLEREAIGEKRKRESSASKEFSFSSSFFAPLSPSFRALFFRSGLRDDDGDRNSKQWNSPWFLPL